MIEITHPKVASLAPEWAPFGGCTIIFDRIGRPGDGTGPLHSALADARSQVPEAYWRALAFCPLPVESLHLTVADLLSQGNLSQLPPEDRDRLCHEPDRIDGTLAAAAVADLVERSGILGVDVSALRFRLDRIAVRDARVIVAVLAPHEDGEALAAFDRLIAARSRLGAMLAERFGVALEPYAPHVSLGYLANRALARRAEQLAERIEALIDPAVRRRAFAYGVPRLYSFADMARFDPVAT